MPAKNVAFFGSPAEQEAISRQRRMAEMLQAQSMQTQGTETAPGGFAVQQSPWQHIAKLAQGLGGMKMGADADQKQREMESQRQASQQQMLARGMQQLMGQPEIPQPAPELGGGPGRPGMAPDPAGAAATFGSSPQGAPFLPIALQQMQNQMPQKPPQPMPFTLKPGETRFDPQGNPLANLPEKMPPAAPYTLGPGAGRFGPGGELIAERPMRDNPDQPITPVTIIKDGKRVVIDGRTGKVLGDAPAPERSVELSAIAQKELFEAEDVIQGGQAALSLFQQARELNDKAMGGLGAGALATAGSILPDFARPGTVDATQNLDNILQTAALPQLKAIFGGMPTEGERKILLDVQGSSSKPANVRRDIFDRAEAAINARLRFAAEKAQRLRSGSYFRGEGLPSLQGGQQPQAAPTPQRRSTDTLPAGVRVTRER